jgi:hypothetical protein
MKLRASRIGGGVRAQGGRGESAAGRCGRLFPIPGRWATRRDRWGGERAGGGAQDVAKASRRGRGARPGGVAAAEKPR